MASEAPRAVESVSSYARRAGHEVVVRLHLPDGVGLPETVLRLRLATKQRTVDAAGTVSAAGEGVLLTARVPAERLARGVWRISLVADADDDSPQRLQARLVVGDPRQPIALLAGPRPRTRMPAPPPRQSPGKGGGPQHGRVEQAARAAADRVLSLLPEARASRYRSALRRARRRLSR